MSGELPLAAASRRLRKPAGRPRKLAVAGANRDNTVTVTPLDGARTRINSGETCAQAPALKASALLPRLLTVPAAAAYLSLSIDVIGELLAAGTFHRVTVPAPVTAKRRGGIIRRVLVDREDLDALIRQWKGAP